MIGFPGTIPHYLSSLQRRQKSTTTTTTAVGIPQVRGSSNTCRKRSYNGQITPKLRRQWRKCSQEPTATFKSDKIRWQKLWVWRDEQVKSWEDVLEERYPNATPNGVNVQAPAANGLGDQPQPVPEGGFIGNKWLYQ